MLDGLTARLQKTFQNLRTKGTLSEHNIREGLRDIRQALLEADVNVGVVRDLLSKIEADALGSRVQPKLDPTQQFIHNVHKQLTKMLGDEAAELVEAPKSPTIIVMAGLQGSGKTTTSAKLATKIAENGRVLLVGADIHRPAAQEQLEILSKQASVDFFTIQKARSVKDIAKGALKEAHRLDCSHIIIDTAGRTQIDDAMMDEIDQLCQYIKAHEILFVCDAMAGQSVVEVVRAFDQRLGITGIVLSKLDSDTRGGAALSIRHTTGKPIKFIGVGEKLRDLEVFHPERLARRILGMGDILSLVEKTQAAFSENERANIQKKMARNSFSLDDMLQQIRKMSSIGSIESIMKMLPQSAAMPSQKIDPKKLKQQEAIILSMTPKERKNYQLTSASSRRQRIAKGSGTTTTEVNQLLRSFDQMKRVLGKARKNPKNASKLLSLMGLSKS